MEELKKILFASEQVVEFCRKHQLSDEDIRRNFAALAAFKEGREHCAVCRGDVCENEPEGMIPELERDEFGRLHVVYCDCKRLKGKSKGSLEIFDYTERNIEQLIISPPRRELLNRLDLFCDEYFGKRKKMTKGIYLHGAIGTGKSLLILRFAKKLKEKGASVRFHYYPDLTRKMQNLFGTQQLERLILKLKQADILILDDIGRESNTPYIRDQILGPVLQYRCDNDLPMFVTSNRDFSNLEKHLSETGNVIDKMKGAALLARFRYLMDEYELIDRDYRILQKTQ